MVSAAIFHPVATELVIGAYAVACFGALVRTAAAVLPAVAARLNESSRTTLDGAALLGAIIGTAMVPAAIITGTLSAPPSLASPLLVNKMMLSGLALGLWAGFIHGRWTIGPEIWQQKRLAILYGGIAFAGFQTIILIASLGGLFGRGETVLDLLPFIPHLDGASTLGTGLSALLMLVSLAALVAVLILKPKGDGQAS